MSSSPMQLPTMPRAYTLRLTGLDKDSREWKDSLWKTHEAINKGAQVFCHWFLTMRGGLPPSLANTDPNANEDALQARRILLALSWLTVEDGEGLPDKKYHLDKDNPQSRIDALTRILQYNQISPDEIQEWIKDCKDSLSAKIRDGAVWVNRNQMFKDLNILVTFDDIEDFLFNKANPNSRFLSMEEYLSFPKLSDKDDDSDSTGTSKKEEKPKELAQKAMGWLCDHYGEGKKADNDHLAEAYHQIHEILTSVTAPIETAKLISVIANHLSLESSTLEGILTVIKSKGRESSSKIRLKQLQDLNVVNDDYLEKLKQSLLKDEIAAKRKIGTKGRRTYSDLIEQDAIAQCGFPYNTEKGKKANREMYVVMLDHAARRISQTHSWVKLNEVERFKYEEAINALKTVPEDTQKWLDNYCEERSRDLNAKEKYIINNNAISAWNNIIEAWSKPDIKTEEQRQEVARELQSNPDIDKFGDINLFMDLAAEEAKCVWQQNGKPSADILKTYVKAKSAEVRKRHYKVPAFCHPDPLLHPVFCDFGSSRPNIEFTGLLPNSNDIRTLELELYTSQGVKDLSLKWQSKRFYSEIALGKVSDQEDEQAKVGVSRLHRFAKSASGKPEGPYTVVGKLKNGRLQTSRIQLEKLYEHRNNPEEFQKRLNRLNWFITCSTELQANGPIYEYAETFPDKTVFKWRKKDKKYYIHSDLNNNEVRKGRSKLILSRLPGLRVLSVDLGHRYGAACTVWETLSAENLIQLCKQTGRSLPRPNDICFTEKFSGKKTLFRRIAGDTLPDGTPHPAPWARLDREFLIRLQGEQDNPRKATSDEIRACTQALRPLGFTESLMSENSSAKEQRIDGVLRSFLAVTKQALSRHGTLARIAFNMSENTEIRPGDKRVTIETAGKIKEHLTNTLVMWAELLLTPTWQDQQLITLWKNHVEIPLADLEAKPASEGGYSAKKLKDWRLKLAKSLQPISDKLYDNPTQRQTLAQALKVHWEKQDNKLIKTPLKQAKTILLPKGEQGKAKTNRQMGGLGLNRIANIKILYQLQKAHYTRLKPDGSHETAMAQFAQKTLDTLEQLRENRVKQLSSRILEAALGLGVEGKALAKNKRPTSLNNNPRFQPCQAIVIENLRHYRPDALRTRRENRGLMEWSAGKIRQRLEEDCALYGLHLREVQPSFTSRQDSRTGAPGVRCNDLPKAKLKDFQEKSSATLKNDLDQFKHNLQMAFLKDSTKLPEIVRIPRQGGEVFMTTDPNSPIANGIQADLNAAANIGLKAILDPDWEGSWWMIPMDPATGTLSPNHTGSPVIEGVNIPLENEVSSAKKGKKASSSRQAVYVFRSSLQSSLQGTTVQWQRTVPFWKEVELKVIQRLKQQYGLPEFTCEPAENTPLPV